jgi:uncharacterized protein
MKRNRLVWLLILLLGGVYVAAGLSRISFNVDILRLLPTHLPQVKGLSLFLKNFAQQDELIVTIDAPDAELAKSTAVRLAGMLRSHKELVKNAVMESPWESNPASMSEFLTFLILNQPKEGMSAIQQRLSPEKAAATLQKTMEDIQSSESPAEMLAMGYDPYRIFSSFGAMGLPMESAGSEFSSSDGKFRVLYVRAAKTFGNYKETDAWIHEIKSLCDKSVEGKGISLGFTGEPAFVAEISTGMQGDMVSSAFVTIGLISLIFWLCYGRFTPLFWLVLMLHVIFLLSLATAGLFLNELTVVGAGFASVMIGLSVDYGYFIYQRSLTHQGTARSLQRECLRNIAWTSGTTAAAFFALNLSRLPGLSQLGNMVGLGVCVGVIVMLGLFAPLASRFRKTSAAPMGSRLDPLFASGRLARVGELVTMGMVLLLLGALVVIGPPGSDFSASTFRPRKSESQAALEKLYSRLQDDRGMLSLVVSGKDHDEVLHRLRSVQGILDEATRNGSAGHILSPLPLWPDAARQKANLPLLCALSQELPRLKSTLKQQGFTDDAFMLTESVLGHANAWTNSPFPIWPSTSASEWILRRVARHQDGNHLALGVVEPTPGREEELIRSLQGDGVYLVSWGSLGAELKQTLPRETIRVAVGLLAGILLILAFALRNFRALLLFVLTTTIVLACLAGAMTLLGMKWGFFNLAAVLLLLGTGTDYSILMLLAFQRNGGDAAKARRELGVVIFLCCLSAATGFGTLAWAGNMGLATLGKTCALGLVIDGLISLFLLPRVCSVFWRKRQSAA